MTDKKSSQPPVGSPEYKEWLKKKTAKDFDDLFGDNHAPAEFEEGGAIFGNIENLDKSDAELFPDELEEYSPEERRKNFVVHGSKKEKD